jgi:hypothetical protein
MNLEQYLTNPAGKGSAFARIPQLKKELTLEFKELDSRIEHKLYIYKKRAIYHIIIPSRNKNEKFTYDVIIEVPLDKVPAGEVNIDHVDFQVFSNCPSFVFTYAHIFYKENMLCKWLLNKYDKEVQKTFPTIRNQYSVISMERSLFLALMYIKIHRLNIVSVINTTGHKINDYNAVGQFVRSQYDILAEQKKLKENPNAVNKPFTKRYVRISQKDVYAANKANNTKTKHTMTTKMTNKTKTTKTTKKF